MQCDEDGDTTTSKADVEAIFVVNIERESIRVDDPWKSGWCKKSFECTIFEVKFSQKMF